MQQLIILRHADAGHWDPTGDDFSRPLSAAGKAHAQQIARWITVNLTPPEQILCSAARRTRETIAPLLSTQTSLEDMTDYDPKIYNARVETLVTLLDFAFAQFNRVLLVGHNPGVSHLAAKVTSHSNSEGISGLSTGTLVVVDFSQGWQPGSCRGALQNEITRTDLSVD